MSIPSVPTIPFPVAAVPVAVVGAFSVGMSVPEGVWLAVPAGLPKPQEETAARIPTALEIQAMASIPLILPLSLPNAPVVIPATRCCKGCQTVKRPDSALQTSKVRASRQPSRPEPRSLALRTSPVLRYKTAPPTSRARAFLCLRLLPLPPRRNRAVAMFPGPVVSQQVPTRFLLPLQ